MSDFPSCLKVDITMSKKKGRVVARLNQDARFHIKHDGFDDIIIVPAGFETDFASTPRALWMITPPLGLYSIAALLHDFLYVHHIYSRKQSDRFFRHIMAESQVKFFIRNLMFLGVRLGGARGWKSDGRSG